MHPFVHLNIGFWLYTVLQCRSSVSSNCLVFHTSRGISSNPAAFLFLIFLSTESSSSCVNSPSLMANCLPIILVTGSNCEAYSSFEGVSSDHWIVTAKIRLSLRKNATRTTPTLYYDWALLNNRDIRDKYALALRNKFDALQEKTETHTPNEEYENFVNAHLEAAAECIPTKLRTKPRVPWETLAVREKREDAKTGFKCNRKNPTNTNALKLKKAPNEIANTYLKEQTEYIQNQIDKIRGLVAGRQSRIAWQTVNEVSRRKSTAKAKLKATSQQERIYMWKQYFENLHGNIYIYCHVVYHWEERNKKFPLPIRVWIDRPQRLTVKRGN